MTEYRETLRKLVARQDLSQAEAVEAIDHVLKGEWTEAQIGAFLATLSAKGECVDEIAGGALSMRRHAIRLQSLVQNTLDTVGTGGDGGKTFNISTTVAFVAAGAGATVAKHGNRASSGKSGSADCLEALGFNLDCDPENMEMALNEIGIAFMFANKFHQAMKYAAPVRKQLGVRTLFNMLGPLTNPAGASCQLIGVYAPELTEVFAHVLKNLGSRRVLVVHGLDGIDEISVCGDTRVSELHEGIVRTYNICPVDYFGDYADPKDLEGGEAADNAEILRRILRGEEKGPKLNVVLINAGASLLAASLCKDLKEGIEMSRQAIESGKALEKMEKLVERSRG
jgi:anthranilate phosphoribosyltransferase